MATSKEPQKISNTKASSVKEKVEPITNDPLDNNPPGSASIVQRGVPSREANDMRSKASTATPSTSVMDNADEPENVQFVKNIPYEPPNPLKEARKAAVKQRNEIDSDNSRKEKPRSKGEGTPNISLRAMAHIIRASNSSDVQTSNELRGLLKEIGVNDMTLRQVEEMANHPELFAGDQKPANLQVLGSLPGAQKPVEFEAAPGTTSLPDNRYYPTRYPLVPDEEQLEDGDLIYYVHEDASYTVLSVYQQKREWQTANHLPPMNLIGRVGGDVEETPKELNRSGFIDRKELDKEYDKSVASAK